MKFLKRSCLMAGILLMLGSVEAAFGQHSSAPSWVRMESGSRQHRRHRGYYRGAGSEAEWWEMQGREQIRRERWERSRRQRHGRSYSENEIDVYADSRGRINGSYRRVWGSHRRYRRMQSEYGHRYGRRSEGRYGRQRKHNRQYGRPY